MPSRRWFRWSLGGLAVMGLAWACQDASRVVTPSKASTTRPAFDVSPGGAAPPAQFWVCKEAPSGTGNFHFEIGEVLPANDPPYLHDFAFFLTPGSCTLAKTINTTDVPNQVPAIFTAYENNDPIDPLTVPGFHLVSVSITTTLGGTQEFSGQDMGTNFYNAATCTITMDNGCVITFHNAPDTPPPVTGKTFTVKGSMEGAIRISNGDWVNGGYSFAFKDGSHIATGFSVHVVVSLTGPCEGGGPATDTFSFALKDATYPVPAGNKAWLPTGDQNSVLSWQGSKIASGVCGGIGKLNASKGAVFTATVKQSPSTGSLVAFRFKYRDPAAKGKPNTNCLNTSDPNRAKADVCGASWSGTKLDP